MIRRSVILALASSWLGVASPVVAGELTHAVVAGESASAIAKHYWGEYELADRLLLYNHKPGSTLRVGEMLRVPYSEAHTVVAGESWSGLASRYLSRASVWPVLAALNGSDAGQALAIGQTVEIPVVVRRELQAGQTLSGLADRYYGDRRRADWLAQFNQVDDPARLAVGTPIQIPWLAPRLIESTASQRSPAVEKTQARSIPKREENPSPAVATSSTSVPSVTRGSGLSAEIAAATASFHRGEYVQVEGFLEALCEEVRSSGATRERAAYWQLRSFVDVAFDRSSAACRAHRAAREAGASQSFSTDLVSPKIRAVLAGCRTEVGA